VKGKYLTSRQVKERLEKEARKNLAIRVEPTETPDTFLVLGRGELQLAILVETMRREGYEMQLGNPEVVTREVDGEVCEPIELVVVDVPDAFVGIVTERLGDAPRPHGEDDNPGFGRARLEFRSLARPHRLPRRVPHRDPRHRPAQHAVRRVGAPGAGPMIRRAQRRHRRRPRRRRHALRAHHLQPRGSSSSCRAWRCTRA
jgi:GTP-binding protein